MSKSDFSLANQVAIVTGGGTGIGRAIALEFAEFGADVVIAGRRLDVLEKAAEEIKALGRRSLVVQADISKKTDVDNLVQKVMDEFGVIDILVNKGGISGLPTGIMDAPEDEWDEFMNINLKGYYLCSQAAGKRMVEQKMGNIINLSSGRGIFGRAGITPYSITKAGIIMLTKCLAWELGPHNIRVNAIAPGYTKTEMTRPVWSDPESLKRVEGLRPLGRIAEPNEFGTIALFLASDASSFITGQTIIADGGWSA